MQNYKSNFYNKYFININKEKLILELWDVLCDLLILINPDNNSDLK